MFSNIDELALYDALDIKELFGHVLRVSSVRMHNVTCSPAANLVPMQPKTARSKVLQHQSQATRLI